MFATLFLFHIMVVSLIFASFETTCMMELEFLQNDLQDMKNMETQEKSLKQHIENIVYQISKCEEDKTELTSYKHELIRKQNDFASHTENIKAKNKKQMEGSFFPSKRNEIRSKNEKVVNEIGIKVKKIQDKINKINDALGDLDHKNSRMFNHHFQTKEKIQNLSMKRIEKQIKLIEMTKEKFEKIEQSLEEFEEILKIFQRYKNNFEDCFQKLDIKNSSGSLRISGFNVLGSNSVKILEDSLSFLKRVCTCLLTDQLEDWICFEYRENNKFYNQKE